MKMCAKRKISGVASLNVWVVRKAKERSGNIYRSSCSVNNRAVKWPSRFASWQKPLYKPQRDKSRSRHSIAELGFQRGDSMIESDRKELEQEIVALGQTVATMLADLQLELCSQGKG
jgi:hypothetical protein